MWQFMAKFAVNINVKVSPCCDMAREQWKNKRQVYEED